MKRPAVQQQQQSLNVSYLKTSTVTMVRCDGVNQSELEAKHLKRDKRRKKIAESAGKRVTGRKRGKTRKR